MDTKIEVKIFGERNSKKWGDKNGKKTRKILLTLFWVTLNTSR